MTIRTTTRDLLLPLVFAVITFSFCTLASSQSSPAAGPWTGWIQCDHDVQSQNYQRRETQTWKITQSTPVGMNGDTFLRSKDRIHAAVCSTRTMPHSEIAYKEFWSKHTGSIFIPGLLDATMGYQSCP